MKCKPVLVRLIKSNGNEYDIKFTESELEMTIDHNYYTEMSNNPDEFKFLTYPYN